MDTFIMHEAEPLVVGYEDLEFVRCRARRTDYVNYHDRTPCDFAARTVIDGVPCCGIHARQVEQCKASKRGFLPMWFIRAHALTPAEAEILIPATPTPIQRGAFVEGV